MFDSQFDELGEIIGQSNFFGTILFVWTSNHYTHCNEYYSKQTKLRLFHWTFADELKKALKWKTKIAFPLTFIPNCAVWIDARTHDHNEIYGANKVKRKLNRTQTSTINVWTFVFVMDLSLATALQRFGIRVSILQYIRHCILCLSVKRVTSAEQRSVSIYL